MLVPRAFNWQLLLASLLAASRTEEDQSCDVTTEEDVSSCSAASSSYPPPPLELPEDFVDPCQDSNDSCPIWAQEGECTNNKYYMIEFCPRSCGVCRPMIKKSSSLQNEEDTTTHRDGSEPNPHCVDDLKECPEWAGKGECFVNPVFMLANCKYSCWVCVNIPKDRERGVDEKITAKKIMYSKMNVGTNQLVTRPSNNDSVDDNHKMNRDLLTLRKVISMEEYAKRVIADPSTPNKTRERCSNHHRMCALWAAQGMCFPFGYDEMDEQRRSTENAPLVGKDSVLFMMNMCPLACEMCHEITSLHQCAGKRLPWEEPSFDIESRSINSSFEHKRMSTYNPIFVSHPNAEEESSKDDPYVVVLHNFLSSDEADTLRSLPSATHASGSNATSGWNLRTDAQSNRVIASCLIDNACSQDDNYITIMDRISSLVDVNVSYVEPIELIQFHPPKLPNTTPRLEHNFEVSSLWKPAGPRVLSLFIFLSDFNNYDEEDQEGGSGGLGFPYLDWLSIKPKKGMAVLWPNVRSDDLWQLDPLTKFEYFPFQDNGVGSNYVHFGAMSHIRLYNYTDAYLRGCT
jgi:hypothetical protein